MSKPFDRSREKLVESGMTDGEATVFIQDAVHRSQDERAKSLERIDAQANTNASQRSSQLITLATLLITAAGIFIAQQDIFKGLTCLHKALITIIFATLLTSIYVGIIEYFRIQSFWKKWAEAVVEVGRKIDSEITAGSLQTIMQMNDIHTQTLSKISPTSSNKFAWWQLGLVVAGSAAFMALLIGVMNDFRLSAACLCFC